MSELGKCLSELGNERFLVGVSGGVDSMALLHLLREEGFDEVVVCHLNHGLRGDESDGDERFVREISGGLGYHFRSGRVDVRAMMGRDGGSLETVARGVRHDFFGECAGEFGCGKLLLAHHADDQAETVLWNLMRGSFGCRGMSEVQEMRMGGVDLEIFRPFLKIRKAMLREWMMSGGFAWREDATNAENDVVRNRIRNEVFPLLDEIGSRDVRPMFSRAAGRDEDLRELLRWEVEKAEALDPQGRIHVRVLRTLPAVLQRGVIARFLEDAGVSGISGKLLEECVDLLEVEKGGSVNLPGGLWLKRRQGRIFLEGR